VYKPARALVCERYGVGERRADAQEASAVLGVWAVARAQEQPRHAAAGRLHRHVQRTHHALGTVARPRRHGDQPLEDTGRGER